jgi:hypothetical protein
MRRLQRCNLQLRVSLPLAVVIVANKVGVRGRALNGARPNDE